MKPYQAIYAMIRANPKWAARALMLDAIVGGIFAALLLVLFSDVTITTKGAMVIASSIGLLGCIMWGYGMYASRRLTEQDDADWGSSDAYDAN